MFQISRSLLNENLKYHNSILKILSTKNISIFKSYQISILEFNKISGTYLIKGRISISNFKMFLFSSI